MGDVRNGHHQPPAGARARFGEHGIVEVAGVGTVDGHQRQLPIVPAVGDFIRAHSGGDGKRSRLERPGLRYAVGGEQRFGGSGGFVAGLDHLANAAFYRTGGNAEYLYFHDRARPGGGRRHQVDAALEIGVERIRTPELRPLAQQPHHWQRRGLDHAQRIGPAAVGYGLGAVAGPDSAFGIDGESAAIVGFHGPAPAIPNDRARHFVAVRREPKDALPRPHDFAAVYQGVYRAPQQMRFAAPGRAQMVDQHGPTRRPHRSERLAHFAGAEPRPPSRPRGALRAMASVVSVPAVSQWIALV